jgi:hypothetical protein
MVYGFEFIIYGFEFIVYIVLTKFTQKYNQKQFSAILSAKKEDIK